MSFLDSIPELKRIIGVPKAKPKAKAKSTKKAKSLAGAAPGPVPPLTNENRKRVDKYLTNKLRILKKTKKRVLPLPPKPYYVRPGIGRKLPRPNVKVNKHQKPKKRIRKTVRNIRKGVKKIRKKSTGHGSSRKRISYNKTTGVWSLVTP